MVSGGENGRYSGCALDRAGSLSWFARAQHLFMVVVGGEIRSYYHVLG